MKALLLACLLSLSFHSYSKNYSDIVSAKSVVKLTCYYNSTSVGNDANTSSGWCWKNPLYIVTTLHSVAGVNKIYVRSASGATCTAKVIKVFREGDLALLKLSKSLNLKPLELANVSANSSSTFHIWGFPHGIHEMQGDPIKFSRSLRSVPTLNDIITGHDLKKKLITQGYPLPKAKIIRISSIIRPGHSGAPIMTSSGKVVAVADGGLRGGVARINWAMPVSYVTKLLYSYESIPTKVSIQNNLYSHHYTVSTGADSENNESVLENIDKENSLTAKGATVYKSWSTTFESIYSTLDNDTRKEVRDIIDEGNQDIYDWFKNVSYDVYEDTKTGISVPIPKGFDFSYNDEFELFQLGKGESFGLFFRMVETSSFEEAYDGADLFTENIISEFNNTVSSDFEDDYDELDEDDEYRYVVKFRDTQLENESYLIAIGAEVIKNQGVYFVFASPQFETLEGEDIDVFMQIAVAAEMISFNKH